MKMRNALAACVGVVALSIASVACDNTARGVKEDAADAQRETGQAVDQSKDAAGRYGERTGNAIENAGRAGDAAMETFDVKTALMADRTVDASGVNVDTDHVTKTVILKGHVPTRSQRVTAEEIAKREAVGYRVDNQLTVGK
jgi:osmotically-inducible protein OsmY